MSKILITGANGFVGKALCFRLEQKNKFAVLRSTHFNLNKDDLHIDFSSNVNVQSKLCDINVIIHCAACVHIMNDLSSSPLESFRQVNTYGTLNLAQQAADAGVKRFIFISSIKVNGESTELGVPFKPNDNFIPTDPYGLSKYEAEVGYAK